METMQHLVLMRPGVNATPGRFYQRLDSNHNMLDAAPEGLLRVNRGADANRLNDLLTFMSNAILKRERKYLGCGNIQNSMCQGVVSEQRS